MHGSLPKACPPHTHIAPRLDAVQVANFDDVVSHRVSRPSGRAAHQWSGSLRFEPGQRSGIGLQFWHRYSFFCPLAHPLCSFFVCPFATLMFCILILLCMFSWIQRVHIGRLRSVPIPPPKRFGPRIHLGNVCPSEWCDYNCKWICFE